MADPREMIVEMPATTPRREADAAGEPPATSEADNASVVAKRAPPVSARCIDHVNLSVRDLDKSVDFYARLLGVEIKERGEGGGTRWCILGAREHFYVCFFEVPGGVFKQNDIHINHVGFVVDDIDETIRRIHGLGLRLSSTMPP